MDQQTRFLSRAWRAYLATNGADAEQPSIPHSGEWELNGLRYVVLSSEQRVIAVYRIKQNGALRRMKRCPAGLRGNVRSFRTEMKRKYRDRQPAVYVNI